MNVKEALRATYPVRLYQWVVIWIALTMTWAGGIWGAYVYAQDQREQQDRATAAAVFAAERASYENARDERTRCEQRVDSREQLRGVFLDVFDLIERQTPGSEFVARATVLLDERYPPLSLDDCPPDPTPPEGLL